MEVKIFVFLSCIFFASGQQKHYICGVFQKATSQKIFGNVLSLHSANVSGNFVNTASRNSLFQLISIIDKVRNDSIQHPGKEKHVFTDVTGAKAGILKEVMQTAGDAHQNGSQATFHFDSLLNGNEKVIRHIEIIDKILLLADQINVPAKPTSIVVDNTELGHITLTWILQKSLEAKRKIHTFYIVQAGMKYHYMLVNLTTADSGNVVIFDAQVKKFLRFLEATRDLGVSGFNGIFHWYLSERTKAAFDKTCYRPAGHYFSLQGQNKALSEKYIWNTVMHCKNDPGTKLGIGCLRSYQKFLDVKNYVMLDRLWFPLLPQPSYEYDIPSEVVPHWALIRVSTASTYEPWVHVIDFNQTKVSHIRCGMSGKYGFRYANASSKVMIPICAYGFTIDLLKYLEEKLEFTGSLRISTDGLYGSYNERENKTTGILKDIWEDKSDLALGLSEDSERNKVVDFTTPISVSGGAIAYIQNNRYNSSVFGPFSVSLWLTILACIAGLMFFVWFLERVSPYGQYHLQRRSFTEDEEKFDLAESMNYIWGIFLSGEIMRGKPQTFASHASLILFAFVSILILAAYSANLIAFFVILDEKPMLSGIYDPKLLSDDSKIVGGLVEATSVTNSIQFSHDARIRKLYTRMKTFKTLEKALEALKTRKIDVLLADSPTLKQKASFDHECALKVIDIENSNRAVGIIFKKNSRWKARFNLAVTQLRSSGVMDKMIRLWFHDKKCVRRVSHFQLSIKEMGVVFLLLLAGIGWSIIIALVLHICLLFVKRRERKGGISEQGDNTSDNKKD